MSLPRPSAASLIVTCQLAIVLTGFLAVALYPPREGEMILVPVLPGAGDGMARRAIAAGAVLTGTGPLPDMLRVRGAREPLAAALARHGVLLIAAPTSLCGGGASVPA